MANTELYGCHAEFNNWDGFDIRADNIKIIGGKSNNNGLTVASGENTASGIKIRGARNNIRIYGVEVKDTQTVKTQQYAINFYVYGVGSNNEINDNDLIGNVVGVSNGLPINISTMTDYILKGNNGINPIGYLSGTGIIPANPAVPASTVTYTNNFGYDCMVIITGGTVTVISVTNVTTGLVSGTFIVPSKSTITLTYSVIPTWRWYGN